MQQDRPRKTTPTAAQDPATEERSRVVRITGISDKTTKDALLNFFENKRRSGGGEIADIQYIPEESLADITFRSAEDAERVSQKEILMFDEAQLKLTLKELPKVLPKDDYKLHVMGLSDTTTKDGLLSFMEVVSGEEVRDILFGSNCNAIVTFEEPPDLEKIEQKCSTRALNGSHVIIEQVNICDCIEVSGLGPKTTRDTIMYYFENPRQSGGGDVKNVQYIDEETTALVFFEEHSVVDKVVRREHIINGATVKVAPHYPFLAEISENPGSGKKEKQLKVDLETKVTQATDLSKPHFDLLSFMGFTENINKQFKDLEAWLMEKELKIYFRGPDQVVREANIAVWKTLVNLQEHEMKLPQSVAIILASDALDSFLSKVFKSEHINAVVTPEGCDDTKLLVTAIDRKDVNKAMELIEKVTAEESVHLEQDQKSLTLTEKWKRLMSTFQKSMLLKVTTELTSSTVLIAGIKEEVDKAKREIATFFEKNFIITKLLETDTGRKKFLLRYESVAINNIEESLKDESVKISLDDNEEGISIRGTRDGIDNAFKEVQKLVALVKERSIVLDKPGMKKLFSESKGMKLLSIVENEHNCIIEQFNQDGRVWYTVFASSDKQLDKADRAIKELISEHSKKKSIDNPAIRELSQAQEDRIERLEAKHSTEIVIEKGVGRIVISGVSDDVAEAMKDVYEIILKDQAEMTRNFAELVSKYVQWFYAKDGCETSYDVETNAKIEHAFMNKEDMIKFTLFNDDGKQQHYKIAFGNMTKINMDTLEEAHVVRKVHDMVVDKVVRRKHIINGTTEKVAPRYPFLGEISENPGGEKKEKQLKVDPQTMAFIKKFFNQEFQDLLQETQVNCTWESGSEDLVLSSVENKVEKTKWEESCRTIEGYIHQIITRKVEVSQETFKKVKWQSREICASFKGRGDIEWEENKGLIILRGKKQDVEPLAEQLDNLSETINKEIEYEKAKITGVIDLSKPQFDILNFMNFVENLKKQFKDLEATMVKKELKIYFKGPVQVVREGNTALWKALSKLKEHDMELPKSIVSILASNAGNVFISSEFKRRQIDAVVSFEASDNTKVLITAADREDTEKAMQLIDIATAEEYVHLEQDQTPLMQSEMWEMLMNSFQNSMLLKVTTELASNTVRIAGVKDEVEKAKTQIVTFFENNSFINNFVETSAGCKKVLLRYERVVIKNIEESLKDQSVKVTLDADDEEGISIRGTREGTQKALQKVQNLVDKVKERSIDLVKPEMKKLFSENKGMKLLSIIEYDYNCIIERCTPVQDKKGSIVMATEAGKKLSKQICSYVTPEGKQIILFKGDLTEHKVDVMVNAANQRLQHVGGLAKAIVQKGGQEIQNECDDFVLRNGRVLYGDVVVSRPGKLPCQRLVHAVGPMWPHTRSRTRYGDNETKEELILGQTVSNALGEANGFRSIALPAISAGVFGFPADICAKTIVDSVLEYSEENAHSKLSEIHIVDMNEDVIKAFTKEMTSRFSKEGSFIDSVVTPKKESVKARGKFRGKVKSASAVKGEQFSPRVSSPTFDDSLSSVYMSKKGIPVVGNPHGIMWLTVFASSDKQLDKADCAIKELIREKKKSIDNPAIKELSQAQEDRIARLEANHSTKIVVHKRIGRIVISGISDDVSEAIMEVYEILKEQAVNQL